MALVTVDDVATSIGKELTPEQRARVSGDIDAIQAQLEAWAHQRFEPTTVVDERHVVSDGSRIFTKWGEPANQMFVKYGSTDASPQAYTWNPYAGFINNGYRGLVYVTYSVDLTNVYDYMTLLRQTITRAAASSIMRPDIVRFRLTNSYSVEGLSIQFDAGDSVQTKTNVGELPDVPSIDLVGLLGLKRTVIV